MNELATENSAKYKNLVLVAFATLIAASGSYASLSPVKDVYVYARMNSVNGVKRCVETNAHCNSNPSVWICQIRIVTALGTQDANSSAHGTDFRTFGVGCVTPLFDADGSHHSQDAFPVLDEGEFLFSLELPE